MGEPYGQELITLADFMAKSPVLYSDAYGMGWAYEHGAVSHHCDDLTHLATYDKEEK